MSLQLPFVPDGGAGILASAQRTSREPLTGLHHFWYTPRVADGGGGGRGPVLRVVFYRTQAGNEPVRQWLKGLERADRKVLGEDIKTA